MLSTTEILLRISLACIFGGFIGLERESVNRPAGFRTHILVCVGSALTMLTGIFLFNTYSCQSNLDPARLGAQVISGIGFLGAGTILREGLTVKGLTTAASLWAIACIGIAIGSGFYMAAAITTALVFVILLFFTKFEAYFHRKYNESIIKLSVINRPGQIGLIGTYLGTLNVSISNIKVEPKSDEDLDVILLIKKPRHISDKDILAGAVDIDGILACELVE